MTITGAVQYPPPVHMLRDLRIEFEHGEGESRAWIPAQPELADSQGNVRLGVLATMVDVIGGGLAALAAAPGWIATADLTMHALAPLAADGASMLCAHGRVLRAGRTTVVIECSLTTDDRAPADMTDVAAVATMTFSVLERRDINPVLVPSTGAPVRSTMACSDSRFHDPVLDAFGIEITDRGVASMQVRDYVVNSLGSVQGGALATLAETAAASLGGAVETIDLQMSYLSLAKVGPIVATATDLGDGVATIEIVDAGSQRVTTSAMARLGGLPA